MRLRRQTIYNEPLLNQYDEIYADHLIKRP